MLGKQINKYLQKKRCHTTDIELQIVHNVWAKISLGLLKLN